MVACFGRCDRHHNVRPLQVRSTGQQTKGGPLARVGKGKTVGSSVGASLGGPKLSFDGARYWHHGSALGVYTVNSATGV